MSGQQNTEEAPLRPLAQKHMAAPRERSVMLSAVWDHKGSRTPRAQMRSAQQRGGKEEKKKTPGFLAVPGYKGRGSEGGRPRHLLVCLCCPLKHGGEEWE